MTKNRARKQAARDRAAATGERYVVARRQSAEVATPDLGLLHDLTHRVPGVPAHLEGGLQARRPRARTTAPVHQGPPNQNEPRVLVGWQNRIAHLFGAK
jgi:hypothetical protein